jgi:branched-chain amino acid transport system ATP-binding protein
MLEVRHISVSYNDITVIHDISFKVEKGKVVSIIGSNGAGKSTILRALSGILHPYQGNIILDGVRIEKAPTHTIAEMGVACVLEGRRLFSRLSVIKNLYLGAYTQQTQRGKEESLQRVFDLFPVLSERRNQKAQTLSGGEQQMLAIARGLMLSPKLLILDEPSHGLMPKLVSKIFETIDQIKKEGLTILLVEQNVLEALELADYAYVIQTGRLVLQGDPKELIESDLVKKAYLGM